MPDSMREFMRLAKLVDASMALDCASPGELAGALDRWLDALAAMTGKDRAELDKMDAPAIRALMDRVFFGDGYGDMADVARKAWDRAERM